MKSIISLVICVLTLVLLTCFLSVKCFADPYPDFVPIDGKTYYLTDDGINYRLDYDSDTSMTKAVTCTVRTSYMGQYGIAFDYSMNNLHAYKRFKIVGHNGMFQFKVPSRHLVPYEKHRGVYLDIQENGCSMVQEETTCQQARDNGEAGMYITCSYD